MVLVEVDELGPWIPYWDGAIRPAAPTRFAAGDSAPFFHFGGSTLHGVGKLPGRGRYQEIWLSAPPSREAHEGNAKSKREISFEESWESYLRDLATFHRGNPSFDPQAPEQSALALKNGRERYLASINYSMGQIRLDIELQAEGARWAGRIRSELTATMLARAAPLEPAEGAPGLPGARARPRI